MLYNNEHNHHERKLPKIPKRKEYHSHHVRYTIRHHVIAQTLADIFYEPTIAMLNEFHGVARRA